MMTTARSITLAFSVGMHALLLGGFIFLAKEAPNNAERVYRVALAEFAPAPNLPQAPPAVPDAPAPPPAPVPQKQDVQPSKPVQPKPDVKKNSPKKSDTPVPKEAVAPAQPSPPPAPAAPAGPQPRTMGGLSAYESDSLDQRPSVTRRVEPEYPNKARRMNIQGSVKVRLVVDASGQPRNCEIISATPEGYFEDAALKAVQGMRFAPGKLKGQPVNTLVVLPFAFRLR